MRRLSNPMRLVLQNLVDGMPPKHKFDHRVAILAGAITSLRKRGFIQITGDGDYEITRTGRDALEHYLAGIQ